MYWTCASFKLGPHFIIIQHCSFIREKLTSSTNRLHNIQMKLTKEGPEAATLLDLSKALDWGFKSFCLLIWERLKALRVLDEYIYHKAGYLSSQKTESKLLKLHYKKNNSSKAIPNLLPTNKRQTSRLRNYSPWIYA